MNHWTFFPFFVFLFHLSATETITNHLNIALVNLEPFCMKDPNGKEKGFLVDLAKELLHRVTTSGTQSVTYETHWLALDNGTSETEMWNAVRRQLLNGEADMALVPLTDTSGWNGVVQLSQPYLLAPFLPLVSRREFGAQSPGRISVLDKLRRGLAKGIYVSGSAVAALIENDSRTPIKNLRESLDAKGNETRTQVSTYGEGVSRVTRQPDRNVLIGEELRLEQFVLQAKNCDLTLDREAVIGIGAYTLPISLYVQSQPLLSAINKNLLRMRQDGTISRLKTKWWHVPAVATCKPSDIGTSILGSLETYY